MPLYSINTSQCAFDPYQLSHVFEHPILGQTLVPFVPQTLVEGAVVLGLGPLVVDALEVVEVGLLHGKDASDHCRKGILSLS